MIVEPSKNLLQLFKLWAGAVEFSVEPIPMAGSDRKYFRFSFDNSSVVAAECDNITENEAFFSFSQHFAKKGLRVPKVLAIGDDRKSWLLQDLGRVSLYHYLPKNPEEEISDAAINYYKQALSDLVDFQIKGHCGIDYSKAYPVKEFNRESISWDLNYFKYYFLHVADVDYNERLLQKGFDALIDLVLKANNSFFMYRDFQSRNIMIYNNKPWYIDYQGGRKGLPQYDVVSLLYQSRANLSEELRGELLDYYLDVFTQKSGVTREEFLYYLPVVKLLRNLQVLGAYGFRGIIQNKEMFKKSIPQAINNLKLLLDNNLFDDEMQPLIDILKRMVV
ncbi:MAG: phosphotransferase [Bacteroidota bacterium]|nr:phosphotransferase [Bacteroidota bacterium]